MQRKKKIVGLTLGILLASVIPIGTMFAYFTHNEVQENRLTIGNNVIEIEENFPPPDPKPGQAFVKKPKIENTGTVPCFTRVMVELSDSNIGQYLHMDFDATNWTSKQADGYYYYRGILKPTELSSPLFTKVQVSADAPEELLKDFDIIVYAESVQAGDFTEFADAWDSLLHPNG